MIHDALKPLSGVCVCHEADGERVASLIDAKNYGPGLVKPKATRSDKIDYPLVSDCMYVWTCTFVESAIFWAIAKSRSHRDRVTGHQRSDSPVSPFASPTELEVVSKSTHSGSRFGKIR